MENTRFNGTLLNIAIFCDADESTGFFARAAMMCGWTPASISFFKPSCAALDFCSPSAGGSITYVNATKHTAPGPSSNAS